MRGQGRGKIRRIRRGGKWVYVGDFTDASGTRHRPVLGQDRDTAQRVLIEEIRNRDREKAGLSAELGQDTDLALLASDYISELTTRCSSKHVRMMDSQLAKLPGILHAKQVRDLKPENYEKYRQRQLRKGVASATINTSLVALNGMLRWAVSTRRIAENPMESLRALKVGRAYQKRPRRALTEAETEAFLRAVYEADEQGAERTAATRTINGGTRGSDYAQSPRVERIPQAPLLRTMLEVGTRWGETRQLQWADVDFELGRLRLRASTTKNRRGRVLPLRPSHVDELRGLMAAQHRVLGQTPRMNDEVFLTPRGKPWPSDTGNVRRLLEPIWKAAGIALKNELGEYVTLHSLRHTCATRMARGGWPMAKLQKFMGHQDPRTTQQYYDHLEVEDLAEALELVPEVSAGRQLARVT